jgi:dTDP-4-amino-4,6-dideoxygalactose transaminase
MIIEKSQHDENNARFNWQFFGAAREAFAALLEQCKTERKKILLPAYVGVSVNEGSGVFDPVKKSGIDWEFYHLDASLTIDTADIVKKMKANPGCIVLLIHYFGFKDKNIELIKFHAREQQALIVEDFAHALYTFWQDPIVDFDCAVFSLHKMLPMKTGGMLLCSGASPEGNKPIHNLFQYNMREIIDRRIDNYHFLHDRISSHARSDSIVQLKPKLLNNVPQSFPILVEDRELRDTLYFSLNRLGYGAVSLYHSLIPEIGDEFAAEHILSDRILNLPVHQDADRRSLDKMLDVFFALIAEYETNQEDQQQLKTGTDS